MVLYCIIHVNTQYNCLYSMICLMMYLMENVILMNVPFNVNMGSFEGNGWFGCIYVHGKWIVFRNPLHSCEQKVEDIPLP